MFIPVTKTTLLSGGNKMLATSTAPVAATFHEVYTDSSSIATIYYQLNSALTSGISYAITPGLKHAPGVTKRFTLTPEQQAVRESPT